VHVTPVKDRTGNDITVDMVEPARKGMRFVEKTA